MKKYSKPQMMAKNAPTGSYAAGCPAKDRSGNIVNQILSCGSASCKKCERTK